MRSCKVHARTWASMAIATAVVLILGACSKGEPEKMQSRPATVAPVAPAPASTEAAPTQYAPGEALKERLADHAAAAGDEYARRFFHVDPGL